MNNNPSVSAIIPAKRKRGRPRKHPKPDPYHVGSYDSLNRQENYNGPSGGVNGSQPRQQNSMNDVMLGQPVHGVIEAVFDAGYLLSVRVGNSDTNLKGVVFKPGQYIPVSAENDIAPGVPMISRTEFPIPTQDNAQICRRRHSRSREKYGTARGTHASSTVVSRGGQVLPLMPQTASSSGIPRGNVVPVVLQPVTPSNGVMSEPSSVVMAASKGKAAVDVSIPRSGSSFVQQLEEAEKQAKLQESETMNQQPVQHQSDLNSNSSTEPPASMQIPGYGFAIGDDDEEEADEYEEDDDEEDDDDDEDDDDESDQPLTVEPLQAIQPNLNNRPGVILPHMENYRSGKMTELLQVVQKNVMENQGMQSGGIPASQDKL